MGRAEKRKHHIIYKTTCIPTGRFYVGMHSTDFLEDGYLGSGQRLTRSIKKHGITNHIRQILFELSSRIELRQKEKEIVNETLLLDPLCMNIAHGGEGGWDYINENKLNPMTNPDHPRRAEVIAGLDREKLRTAGLASAASGTWVGRKHKPESIEKMKGKHHKLWSDSKPNPQRGKRWIHNPMTGEAKMLKQDEIALMFALGWRLGQKLTPL